MCTIKFTSEFCFVVIIRPLHLINSLEKYELPQISYRKNENTNRLHLIHSDVQKYFTTFCVSATKCSAPFLLATILLAPKSRCDHFVGNEKSLQPFCWHPTDGDDLTATKRRRPIVVHPTAIVKIDTLPHHNNS